MKSGEVLEVLIDYPLSKERIPASAPKEGGEVLSIEETGPPANGASSSRKSSSTR